VTNATGVTIVVASRADVNIFDRFTYKVVKSTAAVMTIKLLKFSKFDKMVQIYLDLSSSVMFDIIGPRFLSVKC